MVNVIQRNKTLVYYKPIKMGVKELNPYLRENVAGGIAEVPLEQFRGKRVAIDASIYLYKFLYKNERFLEGFFQQVFRLKTNGLTPIYIFDGAPPPEKLKTLIQRKEKKNEIKNTIDEMENKQDDCENEDEKKQLACEIEKMKKKLIYVTKEHIDSLKELLDAMNVQYIQAPGEADLICGQMCRNGQVDMVMSDDMDLLTSGARKVLRNFFITSNKIAYYDLDKILEIMEINYSQWIDFCILCGCDYCDRIPNLGPKNAIKLLKQYGNVENILNNVSAKYKVPENYMDNYNKSIAIFKNEGTVDFEFQEIKHPGFHGVERIIAILQSKTNLTEKQIMNRLNIIFA